MRHLSTPKMIELTVRNTTFPEQVSHYRVSESLTIEQFIDRYNDQYGETRRYEIHCGGQRINDDITFSRAHERNGYSGKLLLLLV